jgi:uncharacterized membrane protein YdjX (TVP38/TMEM64 family)
MAQTSPGTGGRLMLKRWLPAAALLGVLALFFLLGLDKHVTFASLRENHGLLQDWVRRLGWKAPILYVLLYIAVVTFSIPGAGVMSLAGGFLFGTLLATLCIVAGATAGASILFFIAKTSLGDPLRGRAGPWMKRMEAGFAENALSYLLVLRLVPLFPFFIVNLVPAFLGVPFPTFVLATFIGIIPATFVLASVGAGLSSVLEGGGEFSVGSIFTPQVMTALIGLALLALIPVAYKKLKARGGPHPRSAP